MEGSQRRAAAAAARKFTKKTARVTLAGHPGGVVTGRSVGTRMGKGKGKPRDVRKWYPAGGVTHRVTTVGPELPRGVNLLGSRTSGRVTTLPAGW